MQIVRKSLFVAGLLWAVLLLSAMVQAADSKELLEAFDRIHHPKLDFSQVYAVRDVTIQQKDFLLSLDSGVFIPFEATGLDLTSEFSGGLFTGHAWADFRPPIEMERAQMRRYFQSDSLSGRVLQAELYFSPKTAAQIAERLTPIDTTIEKPQKRQGELDGIHDYLIKYDDRRLSFRTLRNLIEPSAHEYLMANCEYADGQRIIYRFDPTNREEIELYKRVWAMANDHIELVCKYAVTSDETYQNLDGFSKERLHSKHYKADVTVEKDSHFHGIVDYTFDVLMSRTQVFNVAIEPQFQIDSIVDSTGKKIPFLRWEDKWHKRQDCYIFLDRPLQSGETVTLTFTYGGDINEFEITEFFASAHYDWCPRYGFRQPATYEFTIRSPKEFTVSCSADKVAQSIDGKYLVTQWITRQPERNVAFDIANVERFQYTRADLPRVDIYFSTDIHRHFIQGEINRQATDSGLGYITQIGSNMKEQIADDIFNAVKLFNFYFGRTHDDRLVATETMEPGGTAYPGYLKLGAATWVNTDHWGYDRMFRSHEVAHQWWGAGVSYATYRDQWLSEAFAEYSSLLYLQQVAGNDVFLDRLDEYRGDIFAGIDRPFTDNETVGAIALGYRNQRYGADDDFDLIVYKKGAFVLHMLRNMLIDLKTFNEDRFFSMMKEWYAEYNDQAPTTADFQRLVEKHTGVNMSWFFRQWVYGSEIPEYEFSYDVGQNENGQYIATCNVLTNKVSDNFQMLVPIEIEFDNKAKVYVRTLILGTDFEFTLPPMDRKPRKIRLNPFLSVLANVKQ